MTLIARLAARTAVVVPRQVRHPEDGHVAPGIRALDPLPHELLAAVELPGRQELAIRQVGKT